MSAPKIAALASLAIVLLGHAAIAQGAGPQYVRSDPKGGATEHRAPETVSAIFDAPLAPSSEMTVFDPCGDEIPSSTKVDGSKITTAVSGKKAGTYVVRYSADGVGDAGSTAGTFSFDVHAGPKCKGEGRHGAGHGNGKKAPDAKGKGRAEADRLSPETSLALVLAIPALIGVFGGVLLRRRSVSQ